MDLLFLYSSFVNVWPVYSLESNSTIADDRKIVKWTATRSYEIFLSQMAVLACFPFAYFSYILSGGIGYSIWVIVAFSLSLFFGGVIYRFRKIVLK